LYFTYFEVDFWGFAGFLSPTFRAIRSTAAGGIFGAAAGNFIAFNLALDNGMGAAHPGPDPDCRGRAIRLTGPALHTGVSVYYLGFTVLQEKHFMGAHLQTSAAADTQIVLKTEGDHISQISQLHLCLLYNLTARRPLSGSPRR
jgi:hypothetical protein